MGIVGIAIAIVSDAEYTSSALLIGESEDGGSLNQVKGLSLLQGLGLSLNSPAAGLTMDIYPDVLLSREVRLAVVRDSFYFRELGKKTSFVEYANRPTLGRTIKRYTIWLPSRMLEKMSASAPAQSNVSENRSNFPTHEEEIAIRYVFNYITPTLYDETGLMNVLVTTNDPTLSANLANSFLRHLAERIEQIRTQKTRQNLEFIEAHFKQAEDSLFAAETALARFNDRNTNPNSARLRTEQTRLERQLNFKADLYRDLQTQLTQERIEFERNRPGVTVLEEPARPIVPSGPSRLLIVITSLFFGAAIGISVAFSKELVSKLKHQEEEYKLAELKSRFKPFYSIKHKFFSRLPKTQNS